MNNTSIHWIHVIMVCVLVNCKIHCSICYGVDTASLPIYICIPSLVRFGIPVKVRNWVLTKGSTTSQITLYHFTIDQSMHSIIESVVISLVLILLLTNSNDLTLTLCSDLHEYNYLVYAWSLLLHVCPVFLRPISAVCLLEFQTPAPPVIVRWIDRSAPAYTLYTVPQCIV